VINYTTSDQIGHLVKFYNKFEFILRYLTWQTIDLGKFELSLRLCGESFWNYSCVKRKSLWSFSQEKNLRSWKLRQNVWETSWIL